MHISDKQLDVYFNDIEECVDAIKGHQQALKADEIKHCVNQVHMPLVLYLKTVYKHFQGTRCKFRKSSMFVSFCPTHFDIRLPTLTFQMTVQYHIKVMLIFTSKFFFFQARPLRESNIFGNFLVDLTVYQAFQQEPR